MHVGGLLFVLAAQVKQFKLLVTHVKQFKSQSWQFETKLSKYPVLHEQVGGLVFLLVPKHDKQFVADEVQFLHL